MKELEVGDKVVLREKDRTKLEKLGLLPIYNKQGRVILIADGEVYVFFGFAIGSIKTLSEELEYADYVPKEIPNANKKWDLRELDKWGDNLIIHVLHKLETTQNDCLKLKKEDLVSLILADRKLHMKDNDLEEEITYKALSFDELKQICNKGLDDAVVYNRREGKIVKIDSTFIDDYDGTFYVNGKVFDEGVYYKIPMKKENFVFERKHPSSYYKKNKDFEDYNAWRERVEAKIRR